MSNYCASARSNRFIVKDLDAFTTEMKKIGVIVSTPRGQLPEDTEKAARTVFISPDNIDESGWLIDYVDENGKVHEINYIETIAPHLEENSVAILYEAGWSESANMPQAPRSLDASAIIITPDEEYSAKIDLVGDAMTWAKCLLDLHANEDVKDHVMGW